MVLLQITYVHPMDVISIDCEKHFHLLLGVERRSISICVDRFSRNIRSKAHLTEGLVVMS